ncbi:MAG TPA: SigE family RNA polymerase sigma factor [Jatrophihabitans sp.]|nr:SigE family RNA polymerase sigma factor [Jatrophihabitans sp.]
MTFEEYARQHTGQLLRLATVLADDRGTAEDVVQEVLIRAHRNWPKISKLSYPHAYLRRMVVNESISWRRKWGHVQAVPDLELERSTAGHEGRHADRDELLAQLRILGPKVRAAIVLRYFEGLSDAEIAESLHCQQVTVRGYIYRGLKALRIELANTEQQHAVAMVRQDRRAQS